MTAAAEEPEITPAQERVAADREYQRARWRIWYGDIDTSAPKPKVEKTPR